MACYFGCKVIVTMVISSLSTAISGDGTVGAFPKCYIAKGASPTATFDQGAAYNQCLDHCSALGTTRFGLGREGYEGAQVRCYCGHFQAFGHMDHTCDYTCDDNMTCGGDNGSPYDMSFQPFWMSVYPVCEPGFYNLTNCAEPCPRNCLDGCHITSGHCIYACVDGNYGDTCDDLCPGNCKGHCSSFGTCYTCIVGWHGNACDKLCPFNCRDECQLRTGLCHKGCNDGWYGSTCNVTCPRNCFDTCDIRSGHCDRCLDSYHGLHCDKLCPETCGHGICDRNDGQCSGQCSLGFYGDFCHLSCPANCSDISCDYNTGFCISGCKQGSYGKTCDTTCSSQCQNNTCQSLTGVCSNGCLPGYHGDFCDTNCSSTCANGTCNAWDGGCTLGCQDGWYGETCQYSCPGGCRYGVCDRITGTCHRGCMDGYHGSTCRGLCPTNCRNHTCDGTSGDCSLGCRAGWMGSKCRIADVANAIPLNMVLAVTVALFVAGATVGIIASYCVCRDKAKHNHNVSRPASEQSELEAAADPLSQALVSKGAKQPRYLVKDEIRMEFNREVYLDLQYEESAYL